MYMLRYRVVYIDEDGRKEKQIIVKEETVAGAIRKYLDTLNEMCKPIQVSELLQFEKN